MPSKRLSLSLRLALMFTASFSLALVSAFLIAYFQIRFTLEKSSKEVVLSKLHESAAMLGAGGIERLRAQQSGETARLLNAPYLIRVIDRDGKVLYSKASTQEKPFDFDEILRIGPRLEDLLGWRSSNAIDDEDVFNLLTERAGDDYIQIGKSSEDREAVLGDLIAVFAICAGIFILCAAALGFWYARRSLAPLRDLLRTFHKIEGGGDLSNRAPEHGPTDELRELSETFNRMMNRIARLVQMMKESLDNVAHDIRTPLTRIRAVAEDAILSSNPLPLREALEECAESATDLSQLVEQLMSISEAEAGTLSLSLSPTDMQLLLSEVCEIYEFVAQEKGIRVEVITSAQVFWIVDRKRLKQAVANLLDNALKFSPVGSAIRLNAEVQRHGESDWLAVRVADAGPGVASGEIDRIWDRLYRGDKSRTTKGLGLGLSIVRAVTLAHGGQALAIPNHAAGMTFELRLPQAPANSFTKRG